MRVLIAALALIGATACCASLSPIERNIVSTVKQEKDNQLHFLEKITNVKSGTLNTEGVRETGEIVRKELEQLGFKTEWVDEPAAMHRAGTLVAVHDGKHGQRLLLIGHLDTVFTDTASFHGYTQKKYSAKGQGVIDDKGGIAVLLYALKALQTSGVLQDSSMMIVLTGDEEDSGKPTIISRKPLIDAAKKSDVALDFEPSITLNTVTIARRGITNWTITTHGNASHSATIFQENVGIGAIFALAHQLDEMREKLQKIKSLSFNPGIILGGSSAKYDAETASGAASGKENVVANIAIAKGDLRYLDAKQKQLVETKIQKLIAAKLPGVKSEIQFVDGIPPMPATKNNLKLLKEYSQVSVDLGQKKVVPLDAGVRGAGDISYVSGVVSASLSGLGPVGNGTHTVIESIELQSLTIQTERAAILMSRLIRKS